LADIHALYRCHDRLIEHKQAVFDHLVGRWRDLFNVSFDVLLYELTSTYFEANPPFPDDDRRRFGCSRDKRSDCVQVVIALIVTPEGLPLAYEVLPGNTADCTTLKGFLERIERQYGKARRVWVMDRGIPTEAVLEEMRRADPPVSYLVGTPKGRLSRLEKDLVAKPWQEARDGVQVKLLPQDDEVYVFAESRDRVAKERAMRRRQLKWPVDAAQAALGHADDARGALDEARCRPRQGAHGMAPRRDQGRCPRRCLHLSARPRQAQKDATPRGPLSSTHQSRRGRPRQALDLLPPVRGGGGSLQEPQGRSRRPSDLPPA
jgi:hypothetical protein